METTAMRIALENQRTGDKKWLPVGWNWSFLLFSPCLGIPLFRKGLPVWGAVMLALACIEFIAANVATEGWGALDLAAAIAAACLSFYLAWKGNALVARRWVAKGYDFAKPESAEARYARQKWGLETELRRGS
jgi:hypothetical protein